MAKMRQVLKDILVVLEDGLRWLSPQQRPRFLYRAIWGCRYFLYEDKVRRLLRKAAREWIVSHQFSCDFFSEYDLGVNLDGRAVSITIEWKPRSIMEGQKRG